MKFLSFNKTQLNFNRNLSQKKDFISGKKAIFWTFLSLKLSFGI